MLLDNSKVEMSKEQEVDYFEDSLPIIYGIYKKLYHQSYQIRYTTFMIVEMDTLNRFVKLMVTCRFSLTIISLYLATSAH